MESKSDSSNPPSVVMQPLANVPPPTRKPPKGAAFWLTFVAICDATFLSAIDMTAVGNALPTITADLNGGDNFSWVGSAYALASTAFLPLSGHLADAFGRRPVMTASILLFALGSALAGSAQTMNMLIGARSTFSRQLLMTHELLHSRFL